MKTIIRFILTVLILTLSFTTDAQDAVSASGGNINGSGGTVSYTVGQIANSAQTGVGGKVYQGVQQPYEISIVYSIEDAKGISLECKVFPNPTKDILTLSINDYEPSSLSYYLVDFGGMIIENKKITSIECKIDLSSRRSGAYILKIIDSGKEVKTFKIIKN